MKAIDRLYKYIEYKGVRPTRFEKELGMSNGYLGTQSKRHADLGESILNKIIDYCLDINPVWLLTGEGDMLKASTTPMMPPNINVETRPRIPFVAAAGSLSVAADGVTIDGCEMLPVIGAFPKYDFTIMVYGDSMIPEYYPGDEVACLFVKESTFIQWGRAYVLDTSQGIVLKRIYNEGEFIACTSYNTQFEPFNVRKDEVYHMALVVGLIRRY